MRKATDPPGTVASSDAEALPGSGQIEDAHPRVIMYEPVRLQRVELIPEALTIWRQHAARKPTLLLLSNSPLTLPVPELLHEEIDALARTGSSREIARRSDPGRPDPLFLPDMTLDVPLRLGWFRHLVWAVPVMDPENPPVGSMLREQMLGAGLITGEESASLVGDKMPLSMQLRGVPATFAPLAELPDVEGPVLLHIDLGYFQGLYRNEIATPVLGLVARTLTTMRERNIPVLAATFSYGNIEGRISLDVRFQGELLAELLADPKAFDAPLGPHWDQQKDILYLKNFFKKEMVMEKALSQSQGLPNAAWVKFNLFHAAADMNRGAEALQYLAEAVRRDKIYAMQYPELASLAFERGRPDEALRMLKLATNTFPENFHIRLQLAQLSWQLGDRKTALHLVEQLQQLPWSPVYYPQMPDYLQGFNEYLKSDSPLSPPLSPTGTMSPGQIKTSDSGPPEFRPPGHP